MTVFVNNVKTALLMGALMGLFLLVGSMWGTAGMVIALLFGGVMNLVAFFFSDTIALKAMRGREITAGDSQVNIGGMTGDDLYRMVDDLRRRANLPMPKVYICPHDAPNAFATGRSPGKAAVAVTAGLLRLMTREEIEGVIAHELAHVKHRDTLISCIAATIAGVLAFLAYYGFFFMSGRRNSNPLVMIGTVILAAVGAAIIKSMISRSREYAADAEGARIAGSPVGLASALRRLDAASKQIPLIQPNPAQNNLFIIEPFTGKKSILDLFATHPPTEARIAMLMKNHA